MLSQATSLARAMPLVHNRCDIWSHDLQKKLSDRGVTARVLLFTSRSGADVPFLMNTVWGEEAYHRHFAVLVDDAVVDAYVNRDAEPLALPEYFLKAFPRVQSILTGMSFRHQKVDVDFDRYERLIHTAMADTDSHAVKVWLGFLDAGFDVKWHAGLKTLHASAALYFANEASMGEVLSGNTKNLPTAFVRWYQEMRTDAESGNLYGPSGRNTRQEAGGVSFKFAPSGASS